VRGNPMSLMVDEAGPIYMGDAREKMKLST